MRRIVLFSTPYENENLQEILNLIFPLEMKEKKVLLMPSQGIQNTPQGFLDDWKDFGKIYGLKVDLIDNNSKNKDEEIKKLMEYNILIISGGDPFILIHNLRKSGLDSGILEFTNKEDFILAGYSAGAYVLTPKLETAKIFNENYPGGMKYLSQNKLKDFKGLGIINFEIIAHYSKTQHEKIFKRYIKQSKIEVRTIADDEYIVINY